MATFGSAPSSNRDRARPSAVSGGQGLRWSREVGVGGGHRESGMEAVIGNRERTLLHRLRQLYVVLKFLNIPQSNPDVSNGRRIPSKWMRFRRTSKRAMKPAQNSGSSSPSSSSTRSAVCSRLWASISSMLSCASTATSCSSSTRGTSETPERSTTPATCSASRTG